MENDDSFDVMTLFKDDHDGSDIANALAFAELLSDENTVYDVDENTDEENWDKAEQLCSLKKTTDYPVHLEPFELYIEGIITHDRKGPWENG